MPQKGFDLNKDDFRQFLLETWKRLKAKEEMGPPISSSEKVAKNVYQ